MTELIVLLSIIAICLAFGLSGKIDKKKDYSAFLKNLDQQLDAAKADFDREFGDITREMVEILGGRYNSPYDYNLTIRHSSGDDIETANIILNSKREISHYRKLFSALKRQIPLIISGIESTLPPHEYGAWGARAERAERQRMIKKHISNLRHDLESRIDNMLKGLDEIKLQMERQLLSLKKI
jgi:hypothetical protein